MIQKGNTVVNCAYLCSTELVKTQIMCNLRKNLRDHADALSHLLETLVLIRLTICQVSASGL